MAEHDNGPGPDHALRRRRWGRRAWILAAVLLLLALANPVNSGLERLATLIGLAGVWAGLLVYVWRGPARRCALIALTVLLPLPLALPGREPDAADLAARYVPALESYDGVWYLWGAESRYAIDCSGLVRRALMDAYLGQAVADRNPECLRRALSMWWNDMSAEAMRDEYRGMTVSILRTPSLNELDTSTIRPGDLAVASSGVHVLAYLGNDEWIQADSHHEHAHRVTRAKLPSDACPWFTVPMCVVRWTALAE